ncbi:expressed unknown protein [Seminavis robusta]|uniref:tRNA/rRNA methyltransferase SpoU type domain-containing protein n=1 Tax=Seminavis robusta TaxID=568900 RepID=A0A9N8EE48_9STRA|nr:expressed unknown protein [Seminavis robusta]|eukprot:Sro1047_g235120.1 n/a (303) ;mRNA; f:14202-15110
MSDQQQQPQQPPLRQAFLLLENPKKSNNLGPMLRCAAAYGIRTVLAVGYAQCSVEGSHGASKHVDMVAFATVQQAIASLRQQRASVSVIGIMGGLGVSSSTTTAKENTNSLVFNVVKGNAKNHKGEDQAIYYPNRGQNLTIQHSASNQQQPQQSYPIGSRPFDPSAALHCFVICKSTRGGLPASLAQVCDFFVHVPHQSITCSATTCTTENNNGPYRPPLLDIHACLAVVLHHFSEWAGYDERTFEGHKFQLVRHNPQQELEQRQQERKRQKEAILQEEEEMGNTTTTNLFQQDTTTMDGDY